jgi:c-di-GMP-binding flagellar brake protein YcgR
MQVEVNGLKLKDSVRLSLTLPVSGVVIDAVGTVVWAKETRQGIQFTSVSPQVQESIRRFIAEIENMDR